MRRLLIPAAFLCGVGLCALVLAPVLAPVQTYEAWCGLRYGGAIPGAQGLLLTIAQAPAEACGKGPGPWILFTLTNTERHVIDVAYPERPGAELSFQTTGSAAPAAWQESSQAVAVQVTRLPPGGRISFACDLSRWLALSPGRHELRARRVPFGLRGGLPCRSNRLSLTIP